MKTPWKNALSQTKAIRFLLTENMFELECISIEQTIKEHTNKHKIKCPFCNSNRELKQ